MLSAFSMFYMIQSGRFRAWRSGFRLQAVKGWQSAAGRDCEDVLAVWLSNQLIAGLLETS